MLITVKIFKETFWSFKYISDTAILRGVFFQSIIISAASGKQG